MQASAKDLIYNRSLKEARQNHKNLDELFDKIPTEHVKMMHTV
jgi:hypothetical protein